MSQNTTRLAAALIGAATLVTAGPLAAQRPGAGGRPRSVERTEVTRPPRAAPAAPAATAPLPASGRYRLTVSGFRVNRESWDTFLETDGKGDEIAISAEVVVVAPDGKPVAPPQVVRSVVHGDRNDFPEREQAGSRSTMGGLRTGDNVPAVSDPWVGRGKASTSRFPLLLWEGELRLNGNAVVVAPTIWELDSDDVLAVAPANVLLGAEQLVNALAPIAGSIGGLSAVVPVVTTAVATGGQAGRFMKEGMNRPIGVKEGGAYSPKLVVLNVPTAEASLSPAPGRKSGVMEVRYTDPEDLKGDYTLFLQIERLP